MSTVREEIQGFASLPDNWDGYGGCPPSAECLALAAQFLNALSPASFAKIEGVYPNPHGTILLYWGDWDTTAGRYVIMEIGDTLTAWWGKLGGYVCGGPDTGEAWSTELLHKIEGEIKDIIV